MFSKMAKVVENNNYRQDPVEEFRIKACITQSNGQNKYGPPKDWQGDEPRKGSELIVRHIPRDCYEDELIPVFMEFGRVYKFRLMMDFCGTNRGYGFLTYDKPSTAKRIITEMDNYEIRPGHHIKVELSADNKRLFMGGILRTATKREVNDMLKKFVEGVSGIYLFNSREYPGENRGFCFIDFETHQAAAIARRNLILSPLGFVCGKNFHIDWAKPEEYFDEEDVQQMTVIFVRNLPLGFSEAEFRLIIANPLFTKTITRLKVVKDFAFIHCLTHLGARCLINFLDGKLVNGCELIATWARPRNDGPQVQIRSNRRSGAGTLHINNVPQEWNSPCMATTGKLIKTPCKCQECNSNYLNHSANNSNSDVHIKHIPQDLGAASVVLSTDGKSNSWYDLNVKHVPEELEAVKMSPRAKYCGMCDSWSDTRIKQVPQEIEAANVETTPTHCYGMRDSEWLLDLELLSKWRTIDANTLKESETNLHYFNLPRMSVPAKAPDKDMLTFPLLSALRQKRQGIRNSSHHVSPTHFELSRFGKLK